MAVNDFFWDPEPWLRGITPRDGLGERVIQLMNALAAERRAREEAVGLVRELHDGWVRGDDVHSPMMKARALLAKAAP